MIKKAVDNSKESFSRDERERERVISKARVRNGVGRRAGRGRLPIPQQIGLISLCACHTAQRTSGSLREAAAARGILGQYETHPARCFDETKDGCRRRQSLFYSDFPVYTRSEGVVAAAGSGRRMLSISSARAGIDPAAERTLGDKNGRRETVPVTSCRHTGA
ncbi:hypothetical protein J6590_071392 [Homalodisca vitripennis]|nr:hypothetical protein J6590_071392 [Homalodisca vitripennis]